MKILVIVIWFALFFNLSVNAQRLYDGAAMTDYNRLIHLQEHLDSIRKIYGADLQVTSYVHISDYHDSLAINYDSFGRIMILQVYDIGDSSVTYRGNYSLVYKANELIQMELIDINPNYWNHRYNIWYNEDGLPLEVLRVRFTNTTTDTLARYIFAYKGQLLISKTIQGWRDGNWFNQDRTNFEYDSLGRKVSQQLQSTATTGEFIDLGYSNTYSYDDAGRIDRQYFHHKDIGVQRYLEHIYLEDKLAKKVFIYKDDTTSSSILISMYSYDAKTDKLEEVINGTEVNEVWAAFSRELYYYYPNGLLKEYKELAKLPEGIYWDYVNKSQRYYYNRTE